MIDIIDRLEAGLLEQLRQDEVNLQEAEMDRRQAYLRREHTHLLLRFVALLRATAGSADDETATPASLTGGQLGSAPVDERAYTPGSVTREMRGDDHWRRHPAIDEETGVILHTTLVWFPVCGQAGSARSLRQEFTVAVSKNRLWLRPFSALGRHKRLTPLRYADLWADW